MSKSMEGMGPQIPHLANKPGGLGGEIWDLRHDVDEACARLERPGHGGTGVVAVEEWLAPPASDLAYFLAATPFTAGAQTVPVTAAALAAPRNVVIDVVIATGAGAGDVVVHGTDVTGKDRDVTIALPAATGQVDGLAALVSVESVDLPAAGVAFTGTIAVGFGDGIGLGSPIKYRSYGPHVVEELEDGVPAGTPGTFETAVDSPPNGLYLPDTAPAGALNYLLTYERDNS